MERDAVIVAGFGFRGAVEVASLVDALSKARQGHAVQALATAADKAQTPAFRAFSEGLGLPVVCIDKLALAVQVTQTQSEASAVARNTGSVAEASALAAAGKGARLIAPRVISDDRMATCALAEGEGP
ncbi:cobalamin biosynthesis protein [Maliponia aquimaris]|uniref:Cobalamin biosynthesis protein CbiG n=1 Tax=Maliponia aquimaris TaxID=1673631 RepID=A0A238K1V2_9RHOB|nr:cobalamin biosynthesis protein [Maliponia aquimaris]SMX36891.1 cobalamin biosynthesis protein CbiG [Maliponia aquimaris]